MKPSAMLPKQVGDHPCPTLEALGQSRSGLWCNWTHFILFASRSVFPWVTVSFFFLFPEKEVDQIKFRIPLIQEDY